MTSPNASGPACRVSGGDKLPAEIGGGDVLCKEIQAALAGRSLKDAVAVEVIVRSRYSLAARITRGGKQLPELTMDSSDRALTKGSVQRFAQSVAEAAAVS